MRKRKTKYCHTTAHKRNGKPPKRGDRKPRDAVPGHSFCGECVNQLEFPICVAKIGCQTYLMEARSGKQFVER